MGTLDLLKKLKRFLPNETANKLLKNDLVYVETGAVLIVRFNGLYEIFRVLEEKEDFPALYKKAFDKFISDFLDIIYDNGGVFLKFDTNQMNIVFYEELLEEEAEGTILQAIKCGLQLNNIYEKSLKEIQEMYGMEVQPMISMGINYGQFTDLIVGNDKRKERVVLGGVVKAAIILSHEGKHNDILVNSDVYNIIRKDVAVVRKGSNYSIKELRVDVANVELPQDNYLNLKTSLIKAFLPAYLFNDLKKDSSTMFNDYKEGTIIDLELIGIHDYADEFLAKYPEIDDPADLKVFVDDYYFGLNKLFKKVFRLTNNFDGSINRVELSKYGLRILISFSYPKTFENDSTNRIIFIEEVNRVAVGFKKFKHKIIYLSRKMFSSIVGGDRRATYIISAPEMEKLDEFVEMHDDYAVKEFEVDLLDNKNKKSTPGRKPKVTEKQKKQKNREGCQELLKDVHEHKVIGRNKEIIALNQLFREGGKIITVNGDFGSGKTRLVEEIIERMRNENFYIIHSKIENRDNIIDLFKYLIEERSGVTFFDSKELIKEKLDKYFDDLMSNISDIEEVDLFRKKLFILYKVMYNIDTEDSIYDTLSPVLRLENLKEALSLYLIFAYHHYSKSYEGVIYIFDDIDNLKHEEKDLMQYVIQYAISHLVERGNRRNRKEEINKISFMITHHFEEGIEFNKFLKPIAMELAPLKKETMRQLLREIAKGQRLPSEIEKVVLRRASGNPFFLEQYFRYILIAGMVEETENGLEKTKLYKKKTIPVDIKEVLHTNLSKLNPDYLKFLQAASVIGVKFDVEIVNQYFEGFDESLVCKMGTKNFVKKYHTDNTYIFTHPMVGEVLYEMASEEDRLNWHKKVAEFLEKTLEISNLAHCNWLGYHYNKSHQYELATKYLKMAYYDSMEKNFIESAYINLTQAIKYFDEGKEKDELILMKSSILFNISNREEGEADLFALYKKYEKSGDFKFLYEIIISILDNTISYIESEKTKKYLNKLSSVIKKGEMGDKEKGILYKYYALFKNREGKSRDVITYINKAVDYSEKAGDFENICFLQNKLGEVYESKYKFKKSLETLKNALEIAQRENSLKYQSVLLGNLGKLTYKLGRKNDAVKYYNMALSISSTLSLKNVEATCAAQLGNIYLETRNLTLAIENLDRALKIFRALNNLEEISYRLADFGEVYIHQNDSVEAEKSFNKALKIAKEIDSPLAKAYVLLNIGRLKSMKRSYEEAEETYKESLDLYLELDMYKRVGMVYYFLSEMYYNEIVKYEDDPFMKYKNKTKEDIGNILKYMEKSLDFSKRAKNIRYICLGNLLLGKILRRKSRINEAMVHLEEGIEAGKISDYSRLYVELCYELALCFQEQEKFEEAKETIKSGIRLAKKNGDVLSVSYLKEKKAEFDN